MLPNHDSYLYFQTDTKYRFKSFLIEKKLNIEYNIQSETHSIDIIEHYESETLGLYEKNVVYKTIENIDLFKTAFKKLITKFILDFNDELFDSNIIKAEELYNYLITDSSNIFPIQEILMGSGKSTVLTSYIYVYYYYINS